MVVPNIFEALGKLSSLASAKAYADIQPIIADLMEKANTINRENQALAEKATEIENELARFKDFSVEAQKYSTNTEDTGVVTYAHKQPSDEQQKSHRFCPNCFGSMKVRYLQPTKDSELVQHLRGWFRVYQCQDCSSKLTFTKTADYNPAPRSPQRSEYY